MKLNVVVLCSDGIFQRHLAQRVDDVHRLLGLVIHAPPQVKGTLTSRLLRYTKPRALVRYLLARLGLPRYEARASRLRRKLFSREGREPAFPRHVPLIRVSDINAPEAVEFVRSAKPDIILVNGTNLLRKPMRSLARQSRFGIVNLHTGLSPYTRGGNCNLYAILDGKPELVGVTIHFIDGGIDSGDLIATRRVSIEPDDNFETVDLKTFHEGIELMLQCVHKIATGEATRVPQWEQGKLYLRKTGYVYEPFHRLLANQAFTGDAIREYLASKPARDVSVRLVG